MASDGRSCTCSNSCPTSLAASAARSGVTSAANIRPLACSAAHARHTGDGRPRGVLRVPARRWPAQDDRAPGRRLRRRRAARLHARVRRLAQNTDDANHVLSHRPFRPKRAPLSPKPVPKIQGSSCAIASVFCSSDFRPLQATAATSSPSLAGKCSAEPGKA